MASRRSPKRASASSRHRSANNNSAAEAQQPLAPASHQHMPESQDRQQLMSIFGTFPSEAELESQAAAVAAAAEATEHLMSQDVSTGVATDGSPGSSSYNHRTMEFLSPNSPSSANASAASSEQLPENVRFSMPGIARQQQQQQQHFQAGSAQSDRQQRKVVAAYNNQFAHLLGKPVQNVTPSGNLESPSVSLISGSSFNSPRTITLDDLQQSSRMQPRRTHRNNISSNRNTDEAQHTAGQLLKTAASKGKWSQHTTPSPHTTALNAERDSGVFGGQSFTFVTPPNVSTGGTPQPLNGFEPIEELDEDVSWSQAVARSQGVTQLDIERQPMPQFDDSGDENKSYDDMADNGDYSPRPRYDVHVPAPETLARTPTLITRSPTPTRMLEQQQQQRPRTPSRLSSASPSASQSRRPRATTMSAGDQQVTYGNAIGRKSAGGSNGGDGTNVNNSSRETYSTHSRSRSFGSTSTEPITLQQLQSQRIRLQQQQQQQHYIQHRDTPRDELSVSLIPPPPEGGALQFINPFVGRSSGSAGDMPGLDPSEGMPEYLYERQDPQYETADSATRTRIRNRKQRNPSSVMSAGASPIYTRESVYTPSNAGSNMTYEMTYLGMHRTMTASRANTSMVTSEYSTGGLNRGDSRRRSSSVASDRRQQADIVTAAQAELDSSPLPLSTEELRREQRGQMHKRSESVGSSRVISIRDEIEQRQAALAQESAEEAWGMHRQKPSLSQRNNQPVQSVTHTTKTPPVLERWEHARRKTEGKVVSLPPSSSSSSSSVAAGVVSAAAVAMTSHSRKVAQIRERIEEWQQRTETPEPSLTAMPAITSSNISVQDRNRESAATGSSAATTARGAQQNVGEIESVAASAAPSKAAVSPESASLQPAARLVPLTPVLGHRARQEPPSGKHVQAPLERVQALARSNTQASHDSKYSEGTTQSSNVPPSLFGSDRSTFSTPLLSGLPHATVPSNVPSLRTASTAKTMQRQPLHVDPTDNHSSMFLGSVISAVSSPVSVGGHKRQSLVVDAHSASSELLQNVQQVKTASPTVLHAASVASSVSLSSSGISMSQIGEPSIVAKEPRVTTQSVMDSPTANVPSFIGSEERRSWAILYPTDRPPLSNPSNESMGSAELREWDEKLRRRAKSTAAQLDINASASDEIRFRPQITASPAHATDPKTSGGLDLTPPVSEEFRKERKFSALATLEGAKARQQKSPRSRKNRQNRDPLRSGPPSPTVEYPASDFVQLPQPNMQSKFSLSDSSKRTSDLSEASENDLSGGLSADSASSSSGIDRAEQGILQNEQYNYEQLLLSEIATPVANIPRPPSQRMGRHGSSPLNPYNASPTMTASLDSVIPSLPPLPGQPAAQNSAESVPPPLQPAGLFDRLAGTMRRKDRASDGTQGISANDPLVLVSAQTPLPQRWWRNIKESMYAPIPPLHSGQSQQQQAQSATVAAIPAVDDAAVEQLPGRPARRHSFSGSTNIEQNKITAALSPRENVRRKMTLGDRVRGMLRGKRGPLPTTMLGAAAVAGAAAAAGSGSGISVAGPASEHSMYMPDPAGKLNLRIANAPSSSIPSTHPEWAETNPFNSQKLPRRRASFDTLSVHEMAEADRQNMHNRLNHLLNPHIVHASQAGAGISVLASGSHFSLTQSPNLGHVPLAQPFSSSGKFLFTAPSQVSVPDSANGRTPKPLPVTPRRKSQAQDEAAPMQSVFTFPSRQEMVQKNSQPLVSPSPVFNVADSATGSNALGNGEGKQQRQQPAKYDRITGLPITVATTAPVSGTGNLAVSRQEMVQRPPPMISDSVPFSPGSANVPFSPGNTNLYVNTAEIIRPHQLVTTLSQQPTMQQQSENQPQVSANVQKRPSLFRRLTSGWRKPVPTAPNRPTMAGQLEPISEANADYAQNTHGGAMGTMATAAGVAAATGIISHMLQPATHGNASAIAPNNNQGYPAINSDPNGANMNMNPIVNVYTASPQQYSQGPVQPQTQQQQQMSFQPGVMSALSPTMYSQDPNMRPQQPGNMMNMQTPMPGQTQFSANVYQPGPDQSYIQPQVQYSGDSYAPALQHITQPMAAAAAQGSGSSKLMSVMAGIPVLGALFAKKTPPANANVLPPSGGFNPALVGSQPSVAENYGQPPFRPNTSMSYTTSYVGGASPLPDSKPEGFGSIIGKAMEKFHWVQIPLMTYALRESVRRNIAPLVGRYALRYPLVEAEETAAIRAAAEQVKKSNTVQAGALRALDAKEFRHAAPGLRYSALDQRLENTYVPRFSRLPKYRRAPEVWDDEDAHNIAKRVYSRMRGTQQSMNGHEKMRVARALNRANSARRSGEAVLRGGGGHMHRDLERGELSVDGHQGSGERGLGDAESSAAAGGPGGQLLAHRIGAYLAGLRGYNQQREQVRQQNSASFGLSPLRRGLQRQSQPQQRASYVSPGNEGLSRIIDSDVEIDVNFQDDLIRVSVHDSVAHILHGGDNTNGNAYSSADADSDHGSEPLSLRREPTVDQRYNEVSRDITLDYTDHENDGGYYEKEDELRPVNGSGNVRSGGLWQRFFGGQRTEQPAAEVPAQARGSGNAAEQAPAPAPVPNSSHDQQKPSSNSPMFPPFSHLPPRVVDQIMHRVGEPRVFIGSASSQLVPPNNGLRPGDGIFGDASPYRTGTEWNFAESIKFSSPYPTATEQVKNKSVWARINGGDNNSSKTTRKLLAKPRSNEIARWPVHVEIIRDYLQIIALVLGSCGFLKSPLDSPISKRWPWMLVAGVPETLGLLWADLSTTTGKSIGFLIFFGAIAVVALSMWSYAIYLERPPPPRAPGASHSEAADKQSGRDRAKQESEANDGGQITFEEELSVVPSRFNIFGRMFGRVPKRQRMHIIYFVLTTLYIPVVKLCLEAIVWSQGYWAVPNPFRTSDDPVWNSAGSDSNQRDPEKFCYTTTMRNGNFNGAFVVVPLAVLLFIALGMVLPVQVYKLTKRHMPHVPGWLDGKTPGYRLPPANQASRPTSTLAAAAAAPSRANSRASRGVTIDPPARGGTRSAADGDLTRDDPNPMLNANALLQGIDKLGIMNPEVFGNLAMLYGLVNNAGGIGGIGGIGGPNGDVSGLINGVWGHVQKWLARPGGSVNSDPYLGMEKDEAYQARLRDMKESHRNRHLATVQYRRALDSDTADYRFLYVANYPVHASDPARMLLWKLLMVVVAVVLAKDNCWAKSRTRHSLDAGRCAALLLIALLMLRSHHSHRPFFDPTANLAGLLMRIGVLAAVVFAFPLFLLEDPLSMTHMGLCVTLVMINLLVLLALLWLLSNALPRFQVVVRGSSQPLTLSPGILVATSPYDPRLRRLLIERVWQDTWSAILLASRDFRLLPNHRIAFCKTRAHPPYMVNYIGFAAERHLENLHLYDAIGRHAYCQAVQIERLNGQRSGLMDEIARGFTGPDMYFSPYTAAHGGINPVGMGSAVGTSTNFYGIGRSEVQTWFGRSYILHFPFMVCMVYDELPNVVVPISDEAFLRLYLQQNRDDPSVLARRNVRRRLRALDGQHVTLTYIENAGPSGTHHRYCLPPFASENEAYLAQFAGHRRILYRGVVTIKQHSNSAVDGSNSSGAGRFAAANVAPGFECSLALTDEMIVDNEHLVNNLSREHNAFRLAFWQTGHAPDSVMLVRTNITQQSRRALRLNENNRHLLGITPLFDETTELRALFDENSETIDARLEAVNALLDQHMVESHASFVRKRTGLTPSFHIDVFAPGPESFHVQQMAQQAAQNPNAPRPIIPATPALFGGNPALNGQWHNDEHGRLSYIPTMEQLAERLERFEENSYMRDLLVDHRDDITLLYERLRTLVPSESNDPVKFAWYIFWDDLHRRYGKPARQGGVKQMREYDVDFNPLYPQALPYYPLPRHRLERFLFERGLWKPLKMNGSGGSGSGRGLGFSSWLPWGNSNGGSGRRQNGAAAMAGEFDLDPMPVPEYVPGVARASFVGTGMATEARLWRAGEEFDSFGDAPFARGVPATGFIHSGLLNRLYAWLDVIAYGTSR